MKPIGKTLAVLGLLLLAARVQAEDQEEAVARQSENPLSRAVLVPIQNVTSFRLGPFDRTANRLLLQPAVPFPLTSGFDLIAVPVGRGLGYARLLRLRQRLAISFEAQAFTHVVRPEFGPTWSLRFQVEVAYVKLPPPLPPPDDPG